MLVLSIDVVLLTLCHLLLLVLMVWIRARAASLHLGGRGWAHFERISVN